MTPSVPVPRLVNALPAPLSGGVTAPPWTIPYVNPRIALSVPRVVMKGFSPTRVTTRPLARPTTSPVPNPASKATSSDAPAESAMAVTMPVRPMVDPTDRSSPPPIITRASPNPAMQIQEKYTATVPKMLLAVRKFGV